MTPIDFSPLLMAARAVLNPRALSPNAEAGGVAAAILTDQGSIFTGVCIDTACSMGFCAEHAAAAAMVTAGQNRITAVVAVGGQGQPIPPCGRCREFLCQLHPDNGEAEVLVTSEKVATLDDLLPFRWK